MVFQFSKEKREEALSKGKNEGDELKPKLIIYLNYKPLIIHFIILKIH